MGRAKMRAAGAGRENAVVAQARGVAELVAHLHEAIVRSFEAADAGDRVRLLQGVANEILIEMAPAVSWLEVRDSHAADLLKRRLYDVCEEAKACAGLSIPEHAGGELPKSTSNASPSEGAKRTAMLIVTAKFTAGSIYSLADRIESDAQQPPPAGDEHLSEELLELRKWVQEELKGKQRRVLEMTIEAGASCPLSDIAMDTQVNWEAPYDDTFNGICKAVNPKLRTAGMKWRLQRYDNNSQLAKIGQK